MQLQTLGSMTKAKQASLIKLINQKIAEHSLEAYDPYIKQEQFHAAGAKYRERLFMAGNQLGKTVSGGSETAMHLTGRYPSWWQGKVFNKPITAWSSGQTSESTRDTVQRMLMGRINAIGTGMIPKKSIKDYSMKRGVADAIDTAEIFNGGGGDIQADTSLVTFKSYDQGRLKWQGETLELVWFDEEPPEDIYTEGLTRTNATGGLVFLTFTPLLGMSSVVKSFLMTPSANQNITRMTIDDVDHYSEEQKQIIIASYPAHERKARALGEPVLGSGAIFPVDEDTIKEQTFSIPAHWPRIAGLDFGWQHPTACVWLAWDRDSDIVHVYDTHRLAEASPIIHSAAINLRGKWIPVAWPHDGYQHDKGGSCEQLALQYRNQGVNMYRQHATHKPDSVQGQKEGDGGFGTEAGIMEMLDRMQTGRFKVARHLNDFFEEFRLYHRKDGKIVKENDDILSACRIAVMMLRHAKVQAKLQSVKVESYRPSVGGMGM